MDHLKVIGLKFATIYMTVLALFGMFDETSLFDVFMISIITTIVSYLIGDLLVLRFAGNIKATIADFGLGFVLLIVSAYVFVGYTIPLITVSLLGAFFITCVEPFLHGYMVNKIEPAVRHDNRTKNLLQTEFAEEADIYHLNNQDEK